MNKTTTREAPIHVSNHAKLRWHQRSKNTTQSPHHAWQESYPVGIPYRKGSARLHPPTGTLLIHHANELITVLQASLTDYTADHLTTCRRCQLKFQPTGDAPTCDWCGTPTTTDTP